MPSSQREGGEQGPSRFMLGSSREAAGQKEGGQQGPRRFPWFCSVPSSRQGSRDMSSRQREGGQQAPSRFLWFGPAPYSRTCSCTLRTVCSWSAMPVQVPVAHPTSLLQGGKLQRALQGEDKVVSKALACTLGCVPLPPPGWAAGACPLGRVVDLHGPNRLLWFCPAVFSGSAPVECSPGWREGGQ